MINDPLAREARKAFNNICRLQPNDPVKMIGLKNRPELNGVMGRVSQRWTGMFEPDKWEERLEVTTADGTLLKLKRSNLEWNEGPEARMACHGPLPSLRAMALDVHLKETARKLAQSARQAHADRDDRDDAVLQDLHHDAVVSVLKDVKSGPLARSIAAYRIIQLSGEGGTIQSTNMLAHLLYETLSLTDPGAHSIRFVMAVQSATACFESMRKRELEVLNEALDVCGNSLKRINGEFVRGSVFLQQSAICSVDVTHYLREANGTKFSDLVFDVPHIVACMADWIKEPMFHHYCKNSVMGRGMKRYRA